MATKAVTGEGVFWVFERPPEISGKNLTSITKGFKLSFLTKIAFRRWLYMV